VSTYWLKYRGTRFPIRRGETVVGRSPYCSIVLSNSQSSRQHCALRLEGEALSLIDLDSANGTWLNDVRVTEPRQLEAGDIIRVGTDVLEVLPTQSINGERDRPTTHSRCPPDTGESESTQSMSFEEVPHTQTAAGQLELIEALVASASEARRPLALAPMIQRAIEGLIAQAGRQSSMQSSEATRLSAMIEILASWAPDEFADWRKRALATIEANASDARNDHQSAPRADLS